MAIRNFWAEVSVDGYKTKMAGGPRSKNGGMTITVKQRSDGEITAPVKIECEERDGSLFTKISVDGEVVAVHETRR